MMNYCFKNLVFEGGGTRGIALVFEGGGTRGIAYLGAMKVLKRKGIL